MYYPIENDNLTDLIHPLRPGRTGFHACLTHQEVTSQWDQPRTDGVGWWAVLHEPIFGDSMMGSVQFFLLFELAS